MTRSDEPRPARPQRAFPPLPGTLPEALDRAARGFPERAFHLLDGRGRRAGRRSFVELRDSLHLAARRLTALGLRPGDRIVVCVPTSWEWFELWFGAVLAGALPVAVAAPGGMGSPAAQVEKTVRVARRLGARFVSCLPSFAGELAQMPVAEIQALDPELEGDVPPLLHPEQLAAQSPAERLHAPPPKPEDTAFLQLTSGSTGLPRAVQVTHAGAVHNAYACGEGIGRPHGGPVHEWADTLVSWLPLYHDMGLIGGPCLALVNGLDLRLLSPRNFLARPHLWLRMVHDGGLALSPAPNFAYQLCTERIRPRDLEGVRLEGWRSAMAGSEMVRPETMAAFCEAFAPYGFDPRFVTPCYGMAEATLCVSLDSAGEGVRTHPLPAEADSGLGLREVVSNGLPVIDTEIRIAGPNGAPLPPGRVGEVRVRGPGIMSGYYGDPGATAEVVQGGWLCTGDLGFLDAQGELYLTGRLKEILILHGQNVMPHELEWIAEGVTGAGGSVRCGAFSVALGGEGEQAVLVIESSEPDPALHEQLRHDVASRIGRRLGIPLADLMFVRRGSIPKTSSGKVQRGELRERYLKGELKRLS